MKFETVYAKVKSNYYKIEEYKGKTHYFLTEKSAKRKASQIARYRKGERISILKGNDGGYKNSAYKDNFTKRVVFDR